MPKLIIIGSGPAGLTAAIYASRDGLDVLVIEGNQPGGQLTTTTVIENFPGFEEGVNGPELMLKMKKQAQKYGASFVFENVKSVDFSQKPFKVTTETKEYQVGAVIIASGARSRTLGIASEQRFWGKGVHTCATCDGPFYRNKKVIVLGGGDSAMEESLFLARFAEKVFIVHRRDIFVASQIMLEKIKKYPNIEVILNTEVQEFLGEQKLEKIRLFDKQTKKTQEMAIDGVFLAIGHVPNTEFLQGQLNLGKMGYIVPKDQVFTEIPGVFVAGDVSDWRYRQAISAAGLGCIAALEAEKYLEEEI